MFAVASVAASKRFYLEAFAPLGYKVYYETESTVGLADANGVPDLWLRAVKDGEVPAKDFHIAFSAQSRQQVNQFYEAALCVSALPFSESAGNDSLDTDAGIL